MSPRKERKSFAARLISDPWRKLASLALAIGLWYFLDSQVTSASTVSCELRLEDTVTIEGRPSTHTGTVLDVLVPRRDYTLQAFVDARTNDPVKTVTLVFEGPKVLIRRIRPNERFWIEPTPSQLQSDNPVFEFDRTAVVSHNEDYMRAIKAMEPERVRVALARNDSMPLRLSHEHIRVIDNDESRRLEMERLEMENASFFPESITLRGPIDQLAELRKALRLVREGSPDAGPPFDVDLSSYTSLPRRDLRERLVLRQRWADAQIEVSPSLVEVKIPLRPDFRPYELTVRVLVDTGATEFGAGDFEASPTLNVVLNATGSLESELIGKTPEGLRAWANENVRVIAALPRNTSPDQAPIVLGKLVFLHDDWRPGVDYTHEVLAIPLTPKTKSGGADEDG